MTVYEKLMCEAAGTQIIGINQQRMAARLSAIADIGLTPEGGSHRPGYSHENRLAKNLVAAWMNEAGLTVHEDPAGNLFGRLAGNNPLLPSVLCGSHIDTVPNGGHFDGVLGVISALEVASCWQETAYRPQRSIEFVVFADEEGTRFNASLTGSRLMMGELSFTDLTSYHDTDGQTAAAVLQEDGLDVSRLAEARRNPSDFYAHIELHIEQGKVLEQRGLPVGIVNGIAGPAWVQFEWRGEAGHAGATPMNQRRDPLAGAAAWLHAVEQMPARISNTAVATVGKLEVFPGGPNVIPGLVRLIVDIRDICLESRDQLLEAVINEAREIAGKRHLELSVEMKMQVAPTAMADSIMKTISAAVEATGETPFYLPSSAGHDSMVIGRYVPTGMIFVRCRAGISHSPNEWVSLADMATGCRVLKYTLEELTSHV